jgi:hypothetical protein
LKFILKIRGKIKLETEALHEMKSEKALSSEQVFKLDRESEQLKSEMTSALQDKMKAEIITLAEDKTTSCASRKRAIQIEVGCNPQHPGETLSLVVRSCCGGKSYSSFRLRAAGPRSR